MDLAAASFFVLFCRVLATLWVAVLDGRAVLPFLAVWACQGLLVPFLVPCFGGEGANASAAGGFCGFWGAGANAPAAVGWLFFFFFLFLSLEPFSAPRGLLWGGCRSGPFSFLVTQGPTPRRPPGCGVPGFFAQFFAIVGCFFLPLGICHGG